MTTLSVEFVESLPGRYSKEAAIIHIFQALCNIYSDPVRISNVVNLHDRDLKMSLEEINQANRVVGLGIANFNRWIEKISRENIDSIRG